MAGLQLRKPAAHKTAKADWRVADVIASQATRGPIAALDTAESVGLTVAANKVRVIVETSDPALGRAAVTGAGVAVERSVGNLIQVLATPAQLKQLLAAPAVRYLRPPLPHAADAVTDEAVATTNAGTWQQRGERGAGVKVAVIDLGFTGLAAAQASGDLPATVTTVNDCEAAGLDGITEHGTAVAELVHKMAPAAQLYLICVGTDVDLAAAEQYATTNGIQIINHSVSWFNSSRGDGSGGPGSPDADAADALAKGILWVNAAGNAAQAHWSGTFVDDGNGYNTFSLSPLSDTNGVYLPSGASTCVTLKWDDWPYSANDYDLYLFSLDGTQVASSDNPQTGSQSPTEDFCYTNTATSQPFYIAIYNYRAASAPRFDLFVTYGALQFPVAAGSVTEPASSPATVAAGAACWRGTTIEPFSSRGPTIDGRVKPDLTGPDAESTRTYGSASSCAAGFTGTSAAAPTVAGAAALVKGAFPSFTPGDIRSYLETNSTPLGAGLGLPNNTFGHGLLKLPLVTFPSAPTGVTGVGRNQSALVSWTAPTIDGGSAITSYTVTSSPGNKTCTWSSGPLSCTVAGLTNATPYTFTVTASNVAGPGPESDPSGTGHTRGRPRRTDRRHGGTGRHVGNRLVDGTRGQRLGHHLVHGDLVSRRQDVHLDHRSAVLHRERPHQRPVLHVQGHRRERQRDRAGVRRVERSRAGRVCRRRQRASRGSASILRRSSPGRPLPRTTVQPSRPTRSLPILTAKPARGSPGLSPAR